MKKLFLVFTLAFALIFSISAFAADDVIYVSSSGDDNAVGSIDEPLQSIYAAIRALPYGGKIVVCDTVSLPHTKIISSTATSEELPVSNGLITITSVDGDTDYRATNGAYLSLSAVLHFRSPVQFENFDIKVEKSEVAFVCNGNYTVFGENVNIERTSDTFNYPRIIVGSNGCIPANGGYLEIHSGTFSNIHGGASNTSAAAHSGNTSIVIYGGTFGSPIYMTGYSEMSGNTSVYIYGGTFAAGIVGASTGDISGSLYVSIYGGNFTASPAYIRPATNGTLSGSCTINLIGSNLTRVYGVASGSITGDLKINLSSDVSIANCPYETTAISSEDIAKIESADTANIAAAVLAKSKANAENPFEARDGEPGGDASKISIIEKETPGGDLSGDEKITLLDALHTFKEFAKGDCSAAADIDEDGKISINDLFNILKKSLSDGNLITEYTIVNLISDKLSLFGNAVVSDNAFSSGYTFGTVTDGAYTLSSNVTLSDNAVVGLYFGCSSPMPTTEYGYYFEVNTASERMAIYKIIGGDFRIIGEKPLNLLSNQAEIKLTYGKTTNGAQLYFNDNPLEDEHYFDFDLTLEPKGNAVGLYVENAVATTPIVKAESVYEDVPMYKNPLLISHTDPEIFYEDGVYYIYGTGSGSDAANGLICYTTTDFINFTSLDAVLTIENGFGEKSITAANIVKCDDIYYMFYLQNITDSDVRTTGYVTADSPAGPFTNEEKLPLTNETDLIGGQPFVDEDGTAYLVYTRTTGGNKTYISKLVLENGKAELDLTTETLLLAPSESWEYAKNSVVECGFITKHNGTYYLLYAGANYNSTYGVGYATSDNIYGPYTKYEHNPILWSNDQAFGNGAASVFSSPDGKEHFIIYLRNNSPTITRPLNTCIDRIHFVPSTDGGPDILEIAGATVNPQSLPSGIGQTHDIDYQTLRWHW